VRKIAHRSRSPRRPRNHFPFPCVHECTPSRQLGSTPAWALAICELFPWWSAPSGQQAKALSVPPGLARARPSAEFPQRRPLAQSASSSRRRDSPPPRRTYYRWGSRWIRSSGESAVHSQPAARPLTLSSQHSRQTLPTLQAVNTPTIESRSSYSPINSR
jgi:hypothetical protein